MSSKKIEKDKKCNYNCELIKICELDYMSLEGDYKLNSKLLDVLAKEYSIHKNTVVISDSLSETYELDSLDIQQFYLDIDAKFDLDISSYNEVLTLHRIGLINVLITLLLSDKYYRDNIKILISNICDFNKQYIGKLKSSNCLIFLFFRYNNCEF